jgi:GNAT superfamily N-acetyltransferase
MPLQLVRIDGVLPEDFAGLRRAAEAEGHRHMSRLQAEFDSGVQRFSLEGEALLAAYLDGEFVGIAGLTEEPEAPGEARRLRRLYVLPRARHRGVGTAMVGALLNEALGHVPLATAHAGSPDAARFWEALEFRPVEGRAWSHELRAR